MARAKLLRRRCSILVVGVLVLAACREKAPPEVQDAAIPGQAEVPSPQKTAEPTEPPPPELLEPVDLYRDGKPAGQVDAQGADAHKYVFLDLGEGWTPVLFTDGVDHRGAEKPHKFRGTYLALARGEFPDDAYGERAKDDKYLELYGIMPTLAVLRARLAWARDLTCAKELDLAPLASFAGVVTYEGPDQSLRTYKKFVSASDAVRGFVARQDAEVPEALVQEALTDKERAQLQFFLDYRDDFAAIVAAQERLDCEGYFKGKGKWVKGAFDWATHEALAEFERRHRVYSWGAIGVQTVQALRMDTAQNEHEGVIRVLTERAVHAFGAIEDGSVEREGGHPVTYQGADGQVRTVPNLQGELRDRIVQHFGLTSPEATHAFLQNLGELPADGHRYVAIPAPDRPEYYSADMDLSVIIDRGDVWYEFPFDEAGKERSQSVQRRPHTNLYVNYLGQRIQIASFGTTIGGWKSELIDNVVWWKYKGSPAGEVLWREVVSAPVWLPPSSTPPRELLKRRKSRKKDEPKWEPNYHETGPSYASAYGLVAAYHRVYEKDPDGTVRVVKDEGIRSHGSVDYMSIMRRHSHGCHRLHNHLAVRLFSFIVNHRPHVRSGHMPTDFVLDFEYEEEPQHIELKESGYVFRLAKPIFVTVEEGRIRGELTQPIETPIPKFNTNCRAYYLPDGGTVVPSADGQLRSSTPPPDCDAGLPPFVPTPPDAGVQAEDPNLVNTTSTYVPAGETVMDGKPAEQTP